MLHCFLAIAYSDNCDCSENLLDLTLTFSFSAKINAKLLGPTRAIKDKDFQEKWKKHVNYQHHFGII